jgi:MFS family permease
MVEWPFRLSKPPHSAALPPLRGALSTAYHRFLSSLAEQLLNNCSACPKTLSQPGHNHTLSHVLDLLHYLWVENLATQSQSPWRPLRIPLFRNLLIADLVSDIGTFMQSVGAAWLMTSLTTSPMYVALIQTASALPFFVLALPAGSIGDIFDRRKLILRTELWMLGMAIVLAATTLTHTMTPWLLLVLTFGLSAGDAIEAPTWRAIFPELVPKEDLTPALALNGVEFNLARAVGPGLAGLIIAVAGVGTAFVLNALSFMGVIAVIARWKRPVRKSQLPAETLGGATIAALRYVRYSPDIQKLLFRSACVIFFSSAFWALLPAVARGLTESSLGYGLLLGFFGVGAVIGAVVLQRARNKLSVEWVVSGATAVFAVVILAVATLHRLPLLCFLLLFGGAAWTVFMSTFNTLVQNLAPDWVRARVLAIYLFVFQGSVALGSTLWGVAAEHTSANTALLFSSIGVAGCLALPVVARLPAAGGSLEAWNHWGKLSMVTQPEPDEGPVLVAIEYRVDRERVPEFLDALHDYQRIRRRDGAIRWGVFYDAENPGVYLEDFVVESWAEHTRQHDRFTVADRKFEERVLSLVLEPPKTRHFLYANRVEQVSAGREAKQ